MTVPSIFWVALSFCLVLILLITLLSALKFASKKTIWGRRSQSNDLAIESFQGIDNHTRIAKIRHLNDHWIIVFNQHAIQVLPQTKDNQT